MYKIFFSALLVLGSLQDASAHTSTSSIAQEDLPDDKVNLLQSQVEVKKGEAKEAKQGALIEADEDVGASYASATTCSTPEKAAEPIDTKDEDAPKPSSMKPIEATDKASIFTLGNLLQAMALMFVIDALRRCPWKTDASKTDASNNASTKIVSCDASALLAAVLAADESTFEAQVDACPSLLSHIDTWGCSVLHYAAKGGSPTIIERLVNLGASVNALDAWDETPLHLAARAGHTAASETLVAAGALIDSPNAEECTPLIVAGRAEHVAVCHVLIGHGATAGGLDSDMVPEVVRELVQDQNPEAA